MSVYDYKSSATLNDIEEVLNFLPTIHKDFYGTFEIRGSSSSAKYNTYTNMEDSDKYAHVLFENKQDVYDRFFKLLTINDTKEYKINQLKNKLANLRSEQQDITEDIDSIEQNLKCLQEEQYETHSHN